MSCNIVALSRRSSNVSTYHSAYKRSLYDPEGFWQEQARAIPWFKAPSTILDRDSNGVWRWFADGELNTCWLALDRHIAEGRGEQHALIYDSPATGSIIKFTFNQLAHRVQHVAGAMRAMGVEKGDRVLIYLPMVPEAVIGMLACARLGAVHSVVFGGFAPAELAMRIDDAQPKLVLSASCGIEFDRVIAYKPLLDKAIEIALSKPENVVILQREQLTAHLIPDRDHDWKDWECNAEPADCVAVNALDPLYILYTSGTTGKPKGVLRDNGGHAVALHYSMNAVYGVDAGDVFWAASDVGWVVGHSYIVYGPLLKGCTTVLFEGKPVRTPDAGTFWRVIAEHRVKTFFVAPTAFRAIKKEDPDCELLKPHDISSLEYLFVAGEKLDPASWHWLKQQVNVPVIDHWWQTETGWAICANMVGYGLNEMRAGSLTFPVPGFQVKIFDDAGNEVSANTEGNVVIKEPLPPGCLPTVWGDHKRYIDSYWSKYGNWYLTGDGGYFDEAGYIYIVGRTDDVMNVAGHRLSTGQIEDVISAHPAVAECAVVGVQDSEKGQIPIGLVLLKDGTNIGAIDLEQQLVQMVRNEVGAFANFKRAIVVPRLPKTRSGKILRQIMRKMLDGIEYAVPSTIDDPEILNELSTKLTEFGLISTTS